MTHDHQYTFSFGKRYRATRDLSFGFNLEEKFPSGEEFEFREVKYIHYDGCYAYYFRPVSSTEVRELWVKEETSPLEVTTWFSTV